MREHLKAVANGQSSQTERLVGSLHAQLEFGLPEDLQLDRLPDYLTGKIELLTQIGDGITRDFLRAGPMPPARRAPLEQ